MKIKKQQPAEIISLLKEQLTQFHDPVKLEEVGTVLQVKDGVLLLHGLTQAKSGELIQFEQGAKALILNLEEDCVGAVLLSKGISIREGDTAKRTHEIINIKVGEGVLGRVLDVLGEPIDGKGVIEGETISMPIERAAPGIIYRQPVTEPLQTGIKAIDAMVPIGKGQRELIIGDRQTGKSTLIIDTIINQRKYFEMGKPVHCIYVAIGQKASTIVQLTKTLEKAGAMAYTTIIMASAGDPAPLQYLAPFAGAAIGEYFRDTGRDALVIYDDLSKQANAYREISLLLRRPPGREAYPGDIFFLHARLLERAARINNSDKIAQQMNDLPEPLKKKVRGGGSLTALPIIETQAGDVSAYIPTNVISITDGQIFLETDLFNAGIKPAINVGISVSRIGGNAQCKAMKQVAGELKINQAQFYELAAFARFGTELDPATRRTIERGKRNEELLKQAPHTPVPLAEQLAIFYIATANILDGLSIEKVQTFEHLFIAHLADQYQHTLSALESGDKLTKNTEQQLTQAAQEVLRTL